MVITDVMRQTSTGYGDDDSELHVLLVVEAIERRSAYVDNSPASWHRSSEIGDYDNSALGQ